MLAGVAGAALAVDLFLPWYEFPSGRLDAWQSFAVVDVLLALAAAAAIALLVVTATSEVPGVPVATSVWTMLIALIASIAVVVRLLLLPGDASARCYGCYVGTAATLLLLLAAWWSMRDDSPWRGVAASVGR